MDRDEGIRGLGAVDVAEAATDGDDLGGDFVRVEEPAGDIDLVNRLIAKVAAAVVPEPVPIIVHGPGGVSFLNLIGLVTTDGFLNVGRAVPEVVIDVGRNGVLHGRSDGLAALVADGARDLHLAVLAGVHVLDGGADTGAGAALGAGLDDELGEVVRSGDELLAFEDIMGKGLLDVEVLAGLEGPDALDGVQVVGGGDGDGVDVFIFEHLSHVGVTLGAGVFLQALGDDIGVDVAEGDDADALDLLELLDVLVTTAAEADDGDAKVTVGASGLGIGLSAESRHGGSQGGVLNERTTIEVGHRYDWG